MIQVNEYLDSRALVLFDRALKQPEGTRARFIRKAAGFDVALRDRTLTLLELDKTSGSQILTGQGIIDGEFIDRCGDEIGSYRLTDLIGQGGMGAVYRAKRTTGDFDHHVAIKLVRPGALSEELNERLQRERQTLANFSHPNIARLYDGGTTDNGAPYIIMEYIDGAPITEWADHNRLGTDARLDLIQDTCRAVAYAHQNLIIHRDLTPHNVLVEKDGTVKLIDFGIAKAVESDAAYEAGPAIASLSYTPGYAAPERARGSAASTLSDIYSLGKLLGSLMKTRGLRDDLGAIIAKATQNDPSARYSSVDAMVDDVQRYRTRHPVEARAGGRSYRIKKYIQRHRLAVTLGGAIAASLIIGLITTSLMYQQAETARADADTRFNEVRELANFMLFDLYDDLEKVPGNTKSLSDIADKSKTYLDTLSRDKRATPDLTLESAIGYKRLADVMGGPTRATLGRRGEAKSLYLEAIAKLENLHSEDPKNTDVLRALGQATYDYAIFMFIAEDDNNEAIRLSEASIQYYQDIIKSGQATLEDRLNLVHSKKMAAIPLPWIGRGLEGIAAMKLAQKDVLNILHENPENNLVIYASGSIHLELARAIGRHYTAGDQQFKDTFPLWDYAIETRNKILVTKPDDIKLLKSLVKLYEGRGNAHMQLEGYDAAIDDMQAAENLLRKMQTQDPDDLWVMRSLSSIMAESARVMAQAGLFEQATEYGLGALSIDEVLLAKEPENPGRQRGLAYDQSIVGQILMTSGQTRQACEILTAAKTSWVNYAKTTSISEYDQNGNVADMNEALKSCTD